MSPPVDRDPWEGGPKGGPNGVPKGTQWDPMGPKGAFGALGGKGPWDPLGLFRSHFEWQVISNGKPFRVDGIFERQAISYGWSFRMEYLSE